MEAFQQRPVLQNKHIYNILHCDDMGHTMFTSLDGDTLPEEVRDYCYKVLFKRYVVVREEVHNGFGFRFSALKSGLKQNWTYYMPNGTVINMTW